MKHTLNTIYHGIGAILIMLGIVMLIGASGNSDLGMDMGVVTRYEISGLLTCLTGALLTWWRV